MNIDTKIPFESIISSSNLADLLTEGEQRTIGSLVHKEWQIDATSRAGWENKMAHALNLALQVVERKTTPWENASNVKFPLVTIAALQYSARAYPALIPDTSVVKCYTVGSDEDNTAAARAERVSEHMSFQLLEEDEAWEENMDKALIAQAIIGCAFKKSYFDPALKHNVSEHVLAKDLYIPYFAASLEKASRITQVIYLSENDMHERYTRGIFLDWNSKAEPTYNKSELDTAREDSQGVIEPTFDESKPYEVLEQHRWLDLDGDGYQEPYVVYVRKDTQTLLRIVSRFQENAVERGTDNRIISIQADNYYTKFPFIPSPDGGIYDLGFGALLGPLNESINTAINQLIDSGTLSNTAGGFLGRGVKFRSGENSFKPFEWKRVDSTGDDLRKGIFPLPVREPSNVLFQMVGMLVDYGNRIGMATDPQVGENPGQNTPAETSRNMLNEGQRVFNAIYKRTYRALKQEFRKLYKLNSLFMDEETEFWSITGKQNKILWQDYQSSPKDIVPAADPSMISDQDKVNKAMVLKTMSQNGGGYNAYEVEKRVLTALKVPNIEQIYPDPKGPNAIQSQPDPRVVVQTMKLEVAKMDSIIKLRLAQAEMMLNWEKAQAEIEKLRAEAMKYQAEAKGVDTGQKLAAINASIGLLKARQDGVHKSLSIIQSMAETERQINGNSGSGMVGVEDKSSNSGIV